MQLRAMGRSKAVDAETLIEIIRTQTEIVKFGIDLGGVVGYVAERLRQLTHAVSAIVELADGDDMVYRAAAGFASRHLGLRLTRAGSLSGMCIEQNRVLRCDDSETDPRVNREACRVVGLRSMVVAPLEHEGAAVGVLKIASHLPAGFGDREVAILELMCELIAAAMFHASRNETDELYHRSTHDALTGLANRALFCDRLRQRISLADRLQSPFAILNLDMDGLKSINDRHGHRAGDAAIRETAMRITSITRISDTVARLGGDEFGVILADARDRAGAGSVAERIRTAIRLPFVFEGNLLPLGASLGVALFPDDGAESCDLIECADQAMYEMKRSRRSPGNDLA
jgi:diguanylate cyclase (GGDEF)-like protein